jgi:hypothetical protein
MKAIKVIVAMALVTSVGMNWFLWQRLSRERVETEANRASATEVETLRAENETLKKQNATKPAASEPDACELARLRNEVSQFRKQASEVQTLRVHEAQLSQELAAARQSSGNTQTLQQLAKNIAADKHAELEKEVAGQQCINNLKHIGLAARLWANDHNDIFPPDFITMKNELGTPKVLFCPAMSDGFFGGDWSRLKPAEISYRFLNPNGKEEDPTKPLAMCPLHSHVTLSDGSVQPSR